MKKPAYCPLSPDSQKWQPGQECSANFKLKKKMVSLDELWAALESERSIFARHRVYPSAFFLSWPIKLSHQWLARGWFWWVEPIVSDQEILEASGPEVDPGSLMF